METHAAGPWLVLVLVAVALLALAVVLLLLRPRTTRPETPADVPVPAAGEWRDDDLPAFLERPPGSPGSRPAPAPASPAVTALLAASPTPAPRPGPRPTPRPGVATRRAITPDSPWLLAGLTAAALLVIAAATAVALGTGGPAEPSGQAGETAGITTPASLGSVPAAPTSGRFGAGALAHTSVPLGRDGVAARLTFGGLLLEERAVGGTFAYPSVSFTAADDGPALAHVRLPMFNCLTGQPPDDPAAAGCRRTVTEYADLPTPALRVERDGGELRLLGRFPTYVRPNGTPPVYTGRVYDFSITARAAGRAVDGRADVTGVLHLGTDRAGTIPVPRVNALLYGS